VHKVDPSTFDFEELGASVQAVSLTKSEMELRDKFVVEYLKDYDHYAAAIRIGYAPAFAKEFSNRFMNETYVLNKIKQQEAVPDDLADEVTQKRKIATGLWKEANYFGSGSSQSARVAALAKLSAFYGMDAPTRSQQELTGRNGEALGAGVLVVPGLMTAEAWAEQAERQQSELVRPDVSTPALKVVGQNV
jgi:hypothetical protein